jgi:tetratricopeptide (TPR) repeat protein
MVREQSCRVPFSPQLLSLESTSLSMASMAFPLSAAPHDAHRTTRAKAPRSRRLPQAVAAVLIAGCLALLSDRVAEAQVTAQSLVGKAVSGDAEFQDITSGINRFRDRDIEGCRSMLERAYSSNPKLPPPGVLMSMLWLSVNQLQAARGELEQTVIDYPSDPEPYLMLGDLAFQERRVTDAETLFSRGVALTSSFESNPKRKRDFQIRGYAGLAAVAEARKQWPLAEEQLKGWLDLDPDSGSAHQRMGVVLFQLGKPTEALAQFREARNLDSKAVQPELAMARLYDEKKDSDKARRLIELAIEASPDDAAVLLASAQWYLGQNDLESAKKQTDAALKLDEKSLDAKIVRGAIARVERDYETAEAFFSSAHTQSPLNFPASNSLALVLIESDNDESRQRALEMAEGNVALHRENSPQQVNALTTLSWVFYKLGRREDAEQILTQISQSNQLTSDGAYYVSRLLADRGESQRAEAILEQVLATEPVFATRADAEDLLKSLKDGGSK